MSGSADVSQGAQVPPRWLWRLLVLAALGGLLYWIWSAWGHQAVTVWQSQAGPLPFFAAMALLPAIGMPVTPLFLLAGATFGRWMGILGSLAALAVNLAACYWIARSGLRPWLVSLLRRFDHDMPDFSERSGRTVRFVLMVKVTPGLPAFVKNYALGAAGVPFWLYFGVSMLITGTYAAALVLVGESLLEHRLDRTAMAALALVLLSGGLWWWGRRRDREAVD